MLWVFGISSPVLVHCTKENLATLPETSVHRFLHRPTIYLGVTQLKTFSSRLSTSKSSRKVPETFFLRLILFFGIFCNGPRLLDAG
jgi:hypothetical protein